MSVEITGESLVNPTEDEAKVERALHNIFPSAHIEKITSSDYAVLLRVHGAGLEFLATLRNLIRQERIRNAARSIILSSIRDKRIHLYLNKQAAFVGKLSFCAPVGESPYGPISIEIQAADVQAVVDFLASKPGEKAYPRNSW